MQAEDLIAVVFPDQLACAENISGARTIPNHPLINQTLHDCLHEAMDVDGLVRILAAVEQGGKKIIVRDLPHPSPLAQEILNAKPYAFLDDAPLEERRTQAVMSRRWLDPVTASDLGRLDPAAIIKVRGEAWPEAIDPDELHDALMVLGYVTEDEGLRSNWGDWMNALCDAKRATRLRLDGKSSILWVATEQLPMLRAISANTTENPVVAVPGDYANRSWTRAEALKEILRGRVQGTGPVTVASLEHPLGVDAASIETALSELESEGFALRGHFTVDPSPSLCSRPGRRKNRLRPFGGADVHWTSATTPPHPPQGGRAPSPRPLSRKRERGVSYDSSRGANNTRTQLNVEWCERRLLARIHRYTVQQLRAEIEPVSAADFLRFLGEWQGLTGDSKPEGPQALVRIVEQFEGFEAPAIAWEGGILPSRVHEYDPDWLDSQCLAGRLAWARLAPPRANAERERGVGPVRNTPISLVTRRNLSSWQALAKTRNHEPAPLTPAAQSVEQFLRQQGASFFDEIVNHTKLLRSQVETALGELVGWGAVNADSFVGLRALLIPSDRRRRFGGGQRRRRVAAFGIEEAGRWALLDVIAQNPGTGDSGGDPIERFALILLKRYGVVFKRLLEREPEWSPPWYELLRVYRRLEARDDIRGGRFVSGFSGEQYALPEAAGALRAMRKKSKNGSLISISAADPLNLVGILTPGARVPALAGNRVLYRDGVPVASQIGGEARFLVELSPEAAWEARSALVRQPPAPALRSYLN
jgi:ATP-dependent Lhr-like helicase